MFKILLISFCLLTISYAEKTIIAFKNKSCEHKALKTIISTNGINDINHLGHLGMAVLDFEDNFNVENFFTLSSISDCIEDYSENLPVFLDFPTSFEGKEKEWQLKRTNVESLPLPSDYTRKITQPDDFKSHVIIIDTGIDKKHPDLQPRIAPEEQHKSFVDYDNCCENDSDPLCDCGEHGTHCAGLVASPFAGYNPNTTLHSLKVFDYSGSTTYEIILSAMNEAIELRNTYFADELTIVSMSLGGPKENTINIASNRLVEAGIFLVVAAGNESQDALKVSPASAEKAFTVGASDINDNRASFSNYGKKIDIFAPGVDIYSCKPGGQYQYMSGTSMATPFVAGFVSALASSKRLTDPKDIKKEIESHLTKNKIKNSRSTNNNLPYDGEISQNKEDLKFIQ